MQNLEIVGKGATTTIYRDGGIAMKLYIDPPPNEVENEARLQRFAYDAGLPVPRVHGIRKLDERRVALEIDYIPGKPLMAERMDRDARIAAIQTLVALQASVHQVDAAELPRQSDRLKGKIEQAPGLDPSSAQRLLSALARMDTRSTCLCHGDFHPLNILFDGNRHYIIDWVDASAGSPLADACRTYLLFSQFMSRQSGIYLREFCAYTGAKESDVRAWLPIVAAARLAENPDEKGQRLLLKIISDWESAESPRGPRET